MNDILKEPSGDIHPQIRCWKCHDVMKHYSKRGLTYLKCRADCDKKSLAKEKELAKECLNFKGCHCDNKDCLNQSCPLYLGLEKTK